MSAFEPYEGNDPYIFISYARKDKDRVFPLLDALHDLGYRIWRDEGGIPWGVKWMATIEDHLTRAAVCLVFWSEASAASEHCEAEIAAMVRKHRPIVTAFLDDTPVTEGLGMYLYLFQTVALADFDSDTAFIERLDRERVFTSCKAAPKTETPPTVAPVSKIETLPVPRTAWHKDDTIQWYLDRKGVLTIAKNEDQSSKRPVPMPDYTFNWARGSTAPWIPSREKIRSVVIRDDIDTIGSYAFRDCISLTSVTIPDSVTTIGDSAFAWCAGLTSVTIPDSVTTIGDSAFGGCASLTSVTIGDSVTTIRYGAFWGCASLTSVTIPDSVTSIDDRAFYGCTGLTSVKISAGARLGYKAFPDGVQIIRRPPR